jgi:hypothetical protein
LDRTTPRTSPQFMNRDMICTWLSLTDKRWPPDPYALLGLTPTECDAPKIELRVQERMKKLRCYQLSHPEEATEGMNRVAQAFINLIERHAAPVRPASQAAQAAASVAVSAPPRSEAAVQTVEPDTIMPNWQAAPPPVRAAQKGPLPCIPVGPPEAPAPNYRATIEEPAAPVETEEQVILGLAEESDEARIGLVSLPLVLERAALTRQLLIAWRKAGRYLANPKRKLARGVEKQDFTNRLDTLLEIAERYPAFVAHPGRPGYRTVALAHLEIMPEVFNAMGEEPRTQLARDWSLAHKILLAHRLYLLRQFKSLRRRGRLGRIAHSLGSSFRDHPVLWGTFATAVGVTVLVLLGILAT